MNLYKSELFKSTKKIDLNLDELNEYDNVYVIGNRVFCEKIEFKAGEE